MAPFTLPVRGNFNAAGTITTTNTTSAEAEVSNNNAIINGNAAEDSDFDELFDGDVDFSDVVEDSQFSQDSSTAADASAVPEALRDIASRAAEGAADRAHDDPWADDMAEEDVAALHGGALFDIFDVANENGNGAGAHVPAPTAAVDDNTAAPVIPGQNAPAFPGAPAKLPRGRPPGKAPPKAKVTYRCRYGCLKVFVGEVALRKHMMRVHCVFSAAHPNVQKCTGCPRLIDPGNKELACNKRRGERDCPELTDDEWVKINVVYPRNEQEEADTFAYANSGPKAVGPSDLVVVHEGDDEKERREACTKAINNYSNAAVAAARLNNGLPTPEKTPSVVDLTADDEEMPASPTPTYKGKGKKRAVEFSSKPEPKRMCEALPTHHSRYNGLQTGAGPAPRHDSSRNDHVSL